MEKNSRIEIGKTPAEDVDGKVCTHIVDGTPVSDASVSKDNCFDKVAKLVYNVSDQDEIEDDNCKECCKDRPST